MALPKFGLDPPEWKAVQKLRSAGEDELAAALEQHFIAGLPLPRVKIRDLLEDHSTTVDGLKYAHYDHDGRTDPLYNPDQCGDYYLVEAMKVLGLVTDWQMH